MPDGRHDGDAARLWGRVDASHLPDHVPEHLVRSFSFYAGPGIAECPFRAVAALHGESPRIFYNVDDPQCGASWVLTRAVDFRSVFGNPALFSSRDITGFSALMGDTWKLRPLEVDPPEHRITRSLLNPHFAPQAIARMTDGIRARAVALIDRFAGSGQCEFMADFGRPYPVGVFLQLMGLPAEESDQFLAWEYSLLHDLDLRTKAAAANAIKTYLLQLMADRRHAPAGDLASHVATAEIDGRALDDEEVLGIYYLLFVGGLDTVAASLGSYFRHLAENPRAQARLRADPSRIAQFTDEFLRRFSPVTTRRIATADTELAGVFIKKGDWVTCVSALASLDPEEFAEPLELEFERRSNRHLGFGFGPHFCLGSHLARREILVAFEEWIARVPPFRLAPGFVAATHGGPVMGLEALQLVWD